MDYFEMINAVNKRIDIAIHDKTELLSYLLLCNYLLSTGNYRGDTESIYDEVYDYIFNLLEDLNNEHTILERMKKYLSLTDEMDYYMSDEIYLFDGIIELFTNNDLKRKLDVSYVLSTYKVLFETNSFNNSNYKIYKQKKYIDKDQYTRLLSVVPELNA